MNKIPKTLFVDYPRVVCRARFGKKDVPKTLHYFALRGLGEVPRLLLEYTETPYDSVMYFGTQEYKEIAPFAQMPLYHYPELGEGVFIAQSTAICRDIARQTGILGASPKEVVFQDMLWEAGKDIYGKTFTIHTGEVHAELDGVLKGLLKLKSEGKCLSEANRAYGEGLNLGYGEIGIFHSLQTIDEIKPGFLNPYPELMRFINVVTQIPAINRYFHSPRRIPITQNELRKEHTGDGGYTYLSDLNPETVAEHY